MISPTALAGELVGQPLRKCVCACAERYRVTERVRERRESLIADVQMGGEE